MENACEVLIQLITYLSNNLAPHLYDDFQFILAGLGAGRLAQHCPVEVARAQVYQRSACGRGKFYPHSKITDCSAGDGDRRVAANASGAFSSGGRSVQEPCKSADPSSWPSQVTSHET